MIRINEQANPYPAKVIFRGWDKREGETVVCLIEYVRGERDRNGLAQIPSPPVVSGNGLGLVEINVSFSGAVASIKYVYKSVRQANEVASYDVRSFTAETPIYRHKNFPLMFLWYGAGIRRGKVEWAHLDPGEPKVKTMYVSEGGDFPKSVPKRVFESCPDPDSKNTNPMLGVQDFLEGRVEVSETVEYANRAAVPGDVLRKVGAVERPGFLQAGHSGADGVRAWIGANLSRYPRSKWIRSGAKIVSTGSGYRVTRIWLLNTGTPWIPEIYTDRRLTARAQEEA